MFQSFIIVLREGFEAFLIVAIILTYLRKTGRKWLGVAVYWAIAAAVALSVGLAYVVKNGVDESLMRRVFGEYATGYLTWFFNNEAQREATFGVVAIILVASLVIHMWRAGAQLKGKMEKRLGGVTADRPGPVAFIGVFFFTLLMITREGMETALLLLQVREGSVVAGALVGLLAAGVTAWLWARFGHLVNLKRFFQVTAIYLMLFMFQVAIYTFHELTEAGVFADSDTLHAATEAFSPDGQYGKWFSLLMVAACALWLVGAWAVDRSKRKGELGLTAEA